MLLQHALLCSFTTHEWFVTSLDSEGFNKNTILSHTSCLQVPHMSNTFITFCCTFQPTELTHTKTFHKGQQMYRLQGGYNNLLLKKCSSFFKLRVQLSCFVESQVSGLQITQLVKPHLLTAGRGSIAKGWDRKHSQLDELRQNQPPKTKATVFTCRFKYSVRHYIRHKCECINWPVRLWFYVMIWK